MSIQVDLQQLSPQVLEYIQQGESFLDVFLRADRIADSNNIEEIEAEFNLSDGDRLKIQFKQINLAQIVEEGKRNQLLDLDNGWRELHNVLNYDTEEVSYLTTEKLIKGRNCICVNAVLGVTQFNYDGFYRFLTVDEVVQVSTLLSEICESLEERLELLEIDLDESWDEDDISFEQFFQDFVDYYVSASNKGNAMLIVICA